MLASLEVSTSNFNKATENTKDNFMTVASSYLRKIKDDNLEQDFNKALNKQFESIDNKTNELLNRFDNANKEQFKKFEEYQETIDKRIRQTEKHMNTNDSLIKKYNTSLTTMSKGFTGLFFAAIITALVCMVLGPMEQFFGIDSLFDSINHVIKTGHSGWRYLAYIGYVIPYIIFISIILLILKLYERMQ